jgi:hypothetical protein
VGSKFPDLGAKGEFSSQAIFAGLIRGSTLESELYRIIDCCQSNKLRIISGRIIVTTATSIVKIELILGSFVKSRKPIKTG